MYMEEQDFAAKKIDWNVWKRLYRYALQHKKLFFTVIAALIAVAAIDIAYPLFTSYAIDHFVVPKSLDGLGRFAILYLTVILVQGSGVITFIMFAGKLEMEIAYHIRQDAFLRLQELSFSYYDRTAVGYIMARMMSDISRLSDMIAWSLVDVLWSLLYAIGCIITMFVLSWKLALISLAVLPLLAFISIKLQKLMLKYQRESRKLNSRITGAFNEGIMGAVTTKTLVREEANADEFSELTGKMRHATIKSALVSASFFPIIMSLGAVGTGLALTLGGQGVLNPGTALIGALTGKSAEAQTVIDGMKETFTALAARASELEGKSVYFEVSPLQYGLWTAGSGTFMDEIATMLGLTNIFADLSGWAEISEEQVLERNPDIIVTIAMYFGEGPKPVDEILSRTGWQDVTAVKNGDILNLANNELSRPGPRLAEGAQALFDFALASIAQDNAA